jgi:hypothetical protein
MLEIFPPAIGQAIRDAPLGTFRSFIPQDQTAGELEAIVERHAREHPDEPDPHALVSSCRCLARILIGQVEVIAVEPWAACDDHMEFDRQVCQAGLKRFIRRVMKSDLPGEGEPVPLDRKIPILDIKPGDWLIVFEITEKVRVKRSVRIAWLRGPA